MNARPIRLGDNVSQFRHSNGHETGIFRRGNVDSISAATLDETVHKMCRVYWTQQIGVLPGISGGDWVDIGVFTWEPEFTLHLETGE